MSKYWLTAERREQIWVITKSKLDIVLDDKVHC